MSEQPQTEAGRALWFDMTANSGGEALHPLWVEHLRGRIRAIEREAVAAYLASPQAAEELARAIGRVGGLSMRLDNGQDQPWVEGAIAAAILAALAESPVTPDLRAAAPLLVRICNAMSWYQSGLVTLPGTTASAGIGTVLATADEFAALGALVDAARAIASPDPEAKQYGRLSFGPHGASGVFPDPEAE